MSAPEQLRRVAPLVAWSLCVVVASAATPPGDGLGAAGPLGLGVDKWVHLGAYAVTACLAAFALRARDVRRLALAVLVAVALGGGAELLQATLPTRDASLADAAANAVGAVLGAAVYAVRRARTSERER
ncbi:vanz like family protein [Halogeometricum pallidum JCM 14848]|uniref:Vanz like family protein n=1 Tax=Halogeometricum pallidum JCM 14848 TaxID=1227487 RepID=M0D574_HALPD|nr:VanZ family protein [Halogeometricum pallidum]ELZ29842.1 vanz like family protein [Halogeometricum pallidum JCM 14848]